MERDQRISHYQAEIAWDGLDTRYGADNSSLVEKGPTDKILTVFLFLLGIQPDCAAHDFLGIFQTVNSAKMHDCLGVSLGGNAFNKERNRKSIKLDEQRFLKVKVLYGDVVKSHQDVTARTIGLDNLGNLEH